jgi:hypothetical protein
MTQHALLSASSAYRWIQCTKSVRASEHLISKSSKFSEEGSFAHRFSEVTLRYILGYISTEKYEQDMQEMSVSEFNTAEFREHINNYVQYVLKTAENATLILIEQRVDFSRYVPGGFGTADVIIVKDGILHVIDLKFGMGVKVYAKNNPQLRLYALGALELFSDIKMVKTTIVQVRLNSCTTEETTPEELINWAENNVIEPAKLAYEGKGEFKAGDHCKFCPLKVTCIERANHNLSLAKYEFAKPETLSDEDIANILSQADDLASWVKNLKEYALEQAIENNCVPWNGFSLKLVPGKRKYSDEASILKALLEHGYKIEEVVELKGLTALEKQIGKTKFDILVGEYIKRDQSRYALTKLSD